MRGHLLLRAAALAPLLASTGPAFANVAASGPNAELVVLFDSICGREAEPGANFRPVGKEEVPEDLPAQYIGPSTGSYWHRSVETPAFVVRTIGPGHWGGTEEHCIVAVQGAQFEPMVSQLARRTGDRSAFRKKRKLRTWHRGATENVSLTDRRDGSWIVVAKRPGGTALSCSRRK